ncbi:hypothetical protein [Tsuneonella sp. HG222]
MRDALAEELPEPQRLALAHATAATRPYFLAFFTLDARLGGIVRRRVEPMLVQMRLAWWRETLEGPAVTWPRGDPLLEALAGWREPAALAGLAAGWENLLSDRLDSSAIAAFEEGRQAALAAVAREVGAGASAEATEAAARTWALADLAANLSDPAERAQVVTHGLPVQREALPRSLRPLAILAALGGRALERGGRPLLEGRGAALVALRVGMFGR